MWDPHLCWLITPPFTPTSTPDCSHSQRQASTSASSPERAAPSSPSRAPLPCRPGLQTPEETPALHPRPARLGFQLHGPTPGNQGPVGPVLHPAEQRNQWRGKQTPGSYERRLLPGCEVRSSAFFFVVFFFGKKFGQPHHALCFLYMVRSMSSGEKPSSDCEENEYMSPTSLPASGTPWVITGSLVPPPPAQVNHHNDIR